MVNELNSLLSYDESKQIGFNGFKLEQNTMTFEDEKGMPFDIDSRNIEFIINFANPDLPASFYREKKVFTHRC